VDLYWIALGAGGHCVAFNGRVFEAIEAARRHRRRCDLYHAALVVELNSDRYTIEIAPSPARARPRATAMGLGRPAPNRSSPSRVRSGSGAGACGIPQPRRSSSA
jgi:hypothetical protein